MDSSSEIKVGILITAINTAQAALTEASAQVKGLGVAADSASTSSTNLSQKLSGVGSSLKSAGSAFMPFSIAAAAALGASVLLATTFEQKMEMVHTQAGASQKEVDNLKDKVLDLASVVGQSPAKLAEGLFYIESAGFRGAKAMDILKLSAEGAAIGQADLAQTANALTSVMNSQIIGAENAQSAMSTLNAIVGAGKMHFDDLNAAIGTGFLSTAKTFGVSLDSLGAALATMTRNGDPAEQSATRLRMAIVLMGAPTTKAAEALKGIGISADDIKASTKAMTEALAKANVTTNQLSTDLRQPNGLMVAMTDLKTHLEAAGLTSEQAAAVISRAFGGGRTSSGILQLLNDTDNLGKTFDQIKTNSGNFASSWAAQQQTAKQKMDDFRASLDALGVRLGNTILPTLKDFADKLSTLAEKFSKLSPDVQKVAVSGLAITAVLAPILKFGAMIIGIFESVPAAIAIGMVVMGVASHQIIDNFSKLSLAAKIFFADILGPFVAPIDLAIGYLKSHLDDIKKALSNTLDDVKNFAMGVGDWFEKLPDRVKTALERLPYEAGVAVGDMGRAIKSKYDDILKATEDWAKNLPSRVKTGLENTAKAMEDYDKKTLKGWQSFWSGAIKSVDNWAKDFKKSVEKGLSDAGKSISNFFKDLPKTAERAWSNTIVDVNNWGKTFGSAITRAFNTAKTSVSNWFKDMPGEMKKGFDNVKKSITDWFSNLGESLKPAAKKSGEDMAKRHSQSFADIWKSRGTIEKVGDSILEGILGAIALITVTAVIYMIDTGIRLVRSMVTGINNAAQSAYNAARDVGWKVWHGIADVVTDIPRVMGEVMSNTWKAITGWVGKLGSAANNAATSIWSSFKSGLGIKSPSYIEKAFMSMEDQSNKSFAVIAKNGAGLNKLGAGLGFNTIPIAGAAGAVSTATGSSMMSAASQNGTVTNVSNDQGVTVNVNVGTYAGKPGELEQVGTAIYQSLQRIARRHGAADQLPNIGIRPI